MSKTAATHTPKALAETLGISPKVLRAYLRKEHPRTAEAKNTSWVIPETVAAKAISHFEKNAVTDDES